MRVELRFVGVSFCRQFLCFSFSALIWCYEVDADGVIEGGSEIVFYVAHEHAGLADSGIANDEYFE